MSTQIAVRLPDHLVAFLDERVTDGEKSRASVVTKALMQYQRRLSAERDARIYLEKGDYPDLEGLAEWGREQAMDLD